MDANKTTAPADVAAMLETWGMPRDCDFLRVARGEMTLREMLDKENR